VGIQLSLHFLKKPKNLLCHNNRLGPVLSWTPTNVVKSMKSDQIPAAITLKLDRAQAFARISLRANGDSKPFLCFFWGFKANNI
jgi:hypothetical protein